MRDIVYIIGEVVCLLILVGGCTTLVAIDKNNETEVLLAKIQNQCTKK